MQKLRPHFLLVLLIVALLATACGSGAPQGTGADTSSDNGSTVDQAQPDNGEDKSLEELAKEEGTLTVYTVSSPEGSAAVAEAFTRDTGIEVKIFRQTGGPLTETFYADHARGETQADILVHADNSIMYQMCEEGLLAKYVPPNVEDFPPEAVNALDGCAFADRIIRFVVVYNTDVLTGEDLEFVKADPYAAIIDPRFKDQVALPDPNVNSSSFTNQYMIALQKGGVESAEARAFLEAFAANNPVFFSSNGPVVDSVISGEKKLGLLVENFATPLIKQGAPLGIVYPKPTLAMLAMSAVVEHAPHPNAARLYANWLLSERGQQVLNTAYDVAVPHLHLEDQRDYLTSKDWYEEPTEFVYLSDIKKMAEERDTFAAIFNEIFDL